MEVIHLPTSLSVFRFPSFLPVLSILPSPPPPPQRSNTHDEYVCVQVKVASGEKGEEGADSLPSIREHMWDGGTTYTWAGGVGVCSVGASTDPPLDFPPFPSFFCRENRASAMMDSPASSFLPPRCCFLLRLSTLG